MEVTKITKENGHSNIKNIKIYWDFYQKTNVSLSFHSVIICSQIWLVFWSGPQVVRCAMCRGHNAGHWRVTIPHCTIQRLVHGCWDWRSKSVWFATLQFAEGWCGDYFVGGKNAQHDFLPVDTGLDMGRIKLNEILFLNR